MKPRCDESGFTLVEIVCVLAIIALLAAIALPAFPRGTSRARLEALAVATASVLQSDRNAAMRRGVVVSTDINTLARVIQSGAGAGRVQVPSDVAFSAFLPDSCNRRPAGSTISFFASGLSCGGAVSLSRLGATFEIRVAWLTGGVEIVPKKTF